MEAHQTTSLSNTVKYSAVQKELIFMESTKIVFPFNNQHNI